MNADLNAMGLQSFPKPGDVDLDHFIIGLAADTIDLIKQPILGDGTAMGRDQCGKDGEFSSWYLDGAVGSNELRDSCLLYTSDAADE